MGSTALASCHTQAKENKIIKKYLYFQVIAYSIFKVVMGQLCHMAFTYEQLEICECVLSTIANDTLAQ